MSVLHAPQQSDGQKWRDLRIGRFTASDIGDLFVERTTLTPAEIDKYGHLVFGIPPTRPLKSGPRKGEYVTNPEFTAALKEELDAKGIVLFGDAAMKLIARKSGERRTGAEDHHATTKSMDRGTILEPVAKFLLSRHWKPIDEARFQTHGKNAGATPDGLVEAGTEPLDIKAPESFADLIMFDQEVQDNDHGAMERWDRNHYWQLMSQAHFSGSTAANIVLFTDRLPIIELAPAAEGYPGEGMECQRIINWMCERISENRSWPATYEFASKGWWYVPRRFALTEEISSRIDRTLASAEVECRRMEERLKLSKPTQNGA